MGGVIVDCAVYEAGHRRQGPVAIQDALHTADACHDAFVWIGLHEPTAEEFEEVTKYFELHPLAVEDAIHAHQRPKLEHYDGDLFVVLKTARYVDPTEVVDIGQVMLFVGAHFVVTVRHGKSCNVSAVRHELEKDPERLRDGPLAVLYAVVDRVVDDYADVLSGLDHDIDEIEDEVFSVPGSSHAERIFKLKREVMEFRRAVTPLAEPLDALACTDPITEHSPLRPYFRDVHDHVVRINDHIVSYDELLSSALNANVAQVATRQNEDMRKISAWVGIVAVPTMIAGVYGMNFEHMPELGWLLGYPFALLLMGISCLLLYLNFKKRGWL
jgi:magnesium transporter